VQIEEYSFVAVYVTSFGTLMLGEVLELLLLHYAGKRNAELTRYLDLPIEVVHEVCVDVDRMVWNTLKMETCFVRCFGGEMGLTDDVDFAAFVLKHNFRENKGKIKCERGFNLLQHI